MIFFCVDEFKWESANIVIGEGDSFSTSGSAAFQGAAARYNIRIATFAKYIAGLAADTMQVIDLFLCIKLWFVPVNVG